MSTAALLLPPGSERPRSTPAPRELGPLLTSVYEVSTSATDDDIIVQGDGEPSRHKADRRLWRARQGEPGVYRAYPSADEKIIFRVWSVRHHETGQRMTRVYLVSHWKDGELVKRFRRDEPQSYLPLRVLSGRFKITTLPEEHREVLAPIASLFTQAVRHYNSESERWRNRERH